MSGHMRLSIIPGWAATDPRLQGRDLQVLCVLGRHIDKDGWCTRSQVKVAKEIGCARSTIQASLTRLSAIGLVQIRENVTADGRDCSHDYRVLFDVEAPEIVAHPPADQSAPPAGIPAPPADPWDRPPLPTHGSAPYKNDPLKTIPEELERESAGANGQEGENLEPVVEVARTDKQREALFWRAVKDWKDFAAMPKRPALKAWMALTDSEMDDFLERREAYFAELKRAKRDHWPAPSTCFAEKLWTHVPVASAAPKPSDLVTVPPFGPGWMALRLFRLGKGAQALPPMTAIEAEIVGKGGDGAEFVLGRRLRAAFPLVRPMDTAAASAEGVRLPADQAAALARDSAGFVAVSAGSDLWQRWQARFAALGWPWLPDMGRHPTAYFPACEPEAFEIQDGDPASGLPLKGGADKHGRAA